MIFKDRHHAGMLLAEKLLSHRGTNAIVMGLARGGVAVAHAIARALTLPLDVLVVKKISSPFENELALGALAPDAVSFVDWKLAHRLAADEDYIKKVISVQSAIISQKTLLYRKGKRPYQLKDKPVILVDDGAATGATIEAAIRWLRKKHARRIVVALPVAPQELPPKIAPEVAELVILDTPPEFSAVGQFYKHFEQVSDEEVVELLRNVNANLKSPFGKASTVSSAEPTQGRKNSKPQRKA